MVVVERLARKNGPLEFRGAGAGSGRRRDRRHSPELATLRRVCGIFRQDRHIALDQSRGRKHSDGMGRIPRHADRSAQRSSPWVNPR